MFNLLKCIIFHIYSTIQKFGVGKILNTVFLKELCDAQHESIYLIKKH